jgi:hypothetical protein
LKQWYYELCNLPNFQDLQILTQRLIRYILLVLRDTEIDRDHKTFLIACPQGCTDRQPISMCLPVPCENDSLGSLGHSDCGPQLPWLLGRPLRCQVLLHVLESIGTGPPILDPGGAFGVCHCLDGGLVVCKDGAFARGVCCCMYVKSYLEC